MATGKKRMGKKAATRNLTAGRAKTVKGGTSDLAQKLQQQLNEANSVYVRAIAPSPPPAPRPRGTR